MYGPCKPLTAQVASLEAAKANYKMYGPCKPVDAQVASLEAAKAALDAQMASGPNIFL